MTNRDGTGGVLHAVAFSLPLGAEITPGFPQDPSASTPGAEMQPLSANYKYSKCRS